MIREMKIKSYWDIMPHLSDWQKFKFDNEVRWQVSGELGTLKNIGGSIKRLNLAEGNLARSSKIIYAFTLYPSNLLLEHFPWDTPVKLWKDTCTKQFAVEPLVKAKDWNNPDIHCEGTSWIKCAVSINGAFCSCSREQTPSPCTAILQWQEL